jgi:hypothetical protein
MPVARRIARKSLSALGLTGFPVIVIVWARGAGRGAGAGGEGAASCSVGARAREYMGPAAGG